MKKKRITSLIIIFLVISITFHVFPTKASGEGEATQPKVTEVYFNYYDRHYFTLGEELIYYVVFDQLVTVDLSEGVPYIEIGLLGGKKVRATLRLVGGRESGETLLFVYTPQEGDYSPLEINKGNSIELNGGKIYSYIDSSQNIDTTLYNIENMKYFVNAVTPYVHSIKMPENKTYKAGDKLELTVYFSEAVGVRGTSAIPIEMDNGRTAQLTCTYDSYNICSSVKYSYTVQEGDMDADGITLGSSIQGGQIKGETSFNTFVRELNRDLTSVLAGKDTSGIRIDTQLPSIEESVLPANQIYGAGRDLEFIVTYDEPVYVTGIPYIEFLLGDVSKRAEYAEGSGTDRLVFRYTVGNGDIDDDGITVNDHINLNEGVISDVAGNPAPLTTSFGDSSGIKVNATRLAQLDAIPEPGTYIIGDALDFNVKFDQPVYVDTSKGTPCIELRLDGGSTAKALYVDGTGTDRLTFRYTVISGVGDSNGIALDSQIRLEGGNIGYADESLPALTIQELPDTSNIRIEGNPPRVLSVTVPPSGTYDAGEHLIFTVNYDKPVQLNTVDAPPYIELIIKGGTEKRNAEYITGSGTTSLEFGYTVQDDDGSPDGIGIGPEIELSGGTLTGASGNHADLMLNNVGSLYGVKLSGMTPKVVSVSIGEKKIYKENDNIVLQVTFNEKVYVEYMFSSMKPKIELTLDGGRTVSAEYSQGSGTECLEFTYQVRWYGSDGINIGSSIIVDTYFSSIRDSDGNDADLALRGLPDTADIMIDVTWPYAIGVDIPPAVAYKAGSMLDFIIHFNEKIVVEPSEEIPYLSFLLDNIKFITVDYVDGSGTESLRFRYTVKAGDAANTMRFYEFIGASFLRDQAGHTVDEYDINYMIPYYVDIVMDTKNPGIVSVSIPSNGTYTADDELFFTVSFDEPVFADETEQPAVEIILDNEQRAYAAYVDGSGTQELRFSYKVQEGENDSDGIILGDALFISDRAGNNITGTLGNTTDTSGILIDAVRPSIVSVQMDPLYRFLDITFNEAIYGSDDGIAALADEMLHLDFTSNGGNVKDVSISSIKQKTDTYEVSAPELTGGEDAIRVFLNMEGKPSGAETIEISLAAGAFIYDKAGNPNSEDLTTGKIKLSNSEPQTPTPSQPVQGNTPGGGSTPANVSTGTVSTGNGETDTVHVTTNERSTLAELTSDHGKLLSDGQSLSVSLPTVEGVTNYSLSLPTTGLSNNSDSKLTIVTGLGSVILPSGMLTGTNAIPESTVTFSIGEVDPSRLSSEARKAVGTRPVISLSLSIDGEPIRWNNDNAPVTVSIPYTPSQGEDPNAIVIWYIDGDGNLSCVTNGRYDAQTGTVSFTTTHFSHYAVGYNKLNFTDVSDGSWYYDAVIFIAARNITSGTSSVTFSPESTLTRGQFITLLLRAYGIEADKEPEDNFIDAGNTFYTGYLSVAKRLGISAGTGNNKYGPEQPITRQEMFTFLYKTLKLLGKLPEGDSGKTTGSFTDNSDIAPYAREAIDYLVKTGVVNGNNGLLIPNALTTRAQMAQLLYNLMSR